MMERSRSSTVPYLGARWHRRQPVRSIMLALLVAASASPSGGCRSEPPATRQLRQPLDDPADAAARELGIVLPTCGAFPPVGCCDGEALWWCEEGQLKGLSCADRLHCGWSNAGMFDCNTSGQGDPSGNYSRSCPVDDAGQTSLPPLDAGGRDGAVGTCGGIPVEGCCAGDILRYCLDGELRQLNCALNLACGWKANGGLYDCGTAGGEDPEGNFPRACPGAPDARAELLADQGAPDLGGDTDGGADPGPSCSCALQRGPGGGEILIAAGILLLAWARRRAALRDRPGRSR